MRIAAENSHDSAIRLIRTRLNREGFALAPDGVNVARVVGRDGQAHTTTRLGARNAVTLDPANAEGLPNASFGNRPRYVDPNEAMEFIMYKIARYAIITLAAIMNGLQ